MSNAVRRPPDEPPPPELPRHPEKAQAFAALLRNYAELSVTFLTGLEGVILPAFLKEKSPVVTLTYGHSLPIAIPDLKIDDFGISATLSFSRVSHPTFMPWGALVHIQKPGDPPAMSAPRPACVGVPKDFEYPTDPGEAHALQDASKIPPLGEPALRIVR